MGMYISGISLWFSNGLKNIILEKLRKSFWKRCQNILARKWLDKEPFSISYATIYRAIDSGVLPKELKKKLQFKWKHKKCKGEDNCGKIPNTVSIHKRPIGVEQTNSIKNSDKVITSNHYTFDIKLMGKASSTSVVGNNYLKMHFQTFLSKKSVIVLAYNYINFFKCCWSGAENRSRFGHWESDTFLDKRQTGCLGTHVERKSGLLVAFKIPDRLENAFAKATIVAFEKKLYC